MAGLLIHPESAPAVPDPGRYKEEPAPVVAGDPVANEDYHNNPKDTAGHHPHHPQPGPPSHLQHPRPSSIVQQNQQRHPGSPRQATLQQHPGAGAYNSPHSSNHGLPLQHQSPYAQPGPGATGQPAAEVAYYNSHPSPYGTPASGQYSASEAPEMMAAAHMQRPPYPSGPLYHTPQSNSPASVASPQSHDQHGRAMYPQSATQLPQGLYGYNQYPPMNQVHPSPYAQHPGQPQHQAMPGQQPLLMSNQHGQQQMQHPAPVVGQPQGMTNSPRPKLEPSAIQRPLDPSGMQQQQRPPSGPVANNHAAPPAPGGPPPANGMHPNQPGGVNPNAAPGPIPATTPLVVRQDNNGVQWIAFEYSRDRVKMEYTIRCDVESVNVENLSGEFKTENCVYPRACCGKDQYRGNRLIYETECNTVGWALAELNPCLRGKRGLIQRAVDSWRNSNQDPKLRSRRVRRMAKINNRKQVSHSAPNHMAGSGGPGSQPAPAGAPHAPPGMPTANPMAAPIQRPQPSNMTMGSGQMHHHHAHPDGQPGGPDDVSAPPSTVDVRQAQVFHGYPSYPSAPNTTTSLPPPLHNSMDPHLSNAHAITTAGGNVPGINPLVPGSHTVKPAADEESARELKDSATALYGDLPEHKRRKFILVDDPTRGTRVRVRVALENVNLREMPDGYRKTNSVYPRSYFPTQMQSPLSGSDREKRSRINRFVDDSKAETTTAASDDDDGGDNVYGKATIGRTMVPVPMLEGREGEVAVPQLSRAKQRRETTLNELGYRMSWSQSRVFAGRTMFLQKSLDAYRNKMRSSILTSTPPSAANAGGVGIGPAHPASTSTSTSLAAKASLSSSSPLQSSKTAHDANESSAVAEAEMIVSTVPPHFETRMGKKLWLQRRDGRVRKAGNGKVKGNVATKVARKGAAAAGAGD